MEEQAVQIRHLRPEDFQIWKEIRLEAVKNHPKAFGGSFEEESRRTDEQWKGSMSSSFKFGAFIEEKIVGCLGYYINDGEKMKHRAGVFGMYIRSEARTFSREGKRSNTAPFNGVDDQLCGDQPLFEVRIRYLRNRTS
jgi:hypothetical protein